MTQTEVSVCIVTYQARDVLRKCLNSLKESTEISYEVIVVDNGSQDGVDRMLATDFPDIQFIGNSTNAGFTRPMNQALHLGRGRFYLQLNPDTLVLPHSLEGLVDFLEEHPKVGICGPKVLNPDGTLQKPCRRGESRPWAVISYFTGLASLFPRNKFFSQYLMSYMDEDQAHPVAGVSGSCMLIRHEVVDEIGYLDEQFFAYQEDADYCLRARHAGWQVYYVPSAEIIHYGSLGGSRVEPIRSTYEWHRSYFRYYRKHFAKDYFFLLNWAYYLAMLLKLLLALLTHSLRIGKFTRSNIGLPETPKESG